MKKHTLNLFKGTDGEWRWNIVASNGRIVAAGEGYKRRGAILTMLANLFKGTPIARQVAELQKVK